MSFALSIKEEIIRKNFTIPETRCLLTGFLRLHGQIEIIDQTIWCTLSSISAVIIRQVRQWLKQLWQVDCQLTVSKQANFSNTTYYNITFNNSHYAVLEDLQIYAPNNLITLLPLNANWDTKQVRAYAAGLFLACGSVNAPSSANYHLELQFHKYEWAQEFALLLRRHHFNFKIIQNKKRFICYLKKATVISDFLKFIDASAAVLDFENQRIYRDISNSINRFNNIEIHNQQITNTVANKQIHYINWLKSNNYWDELPTVVQQIADIRLLNPEASFQDLKTIYNQKYDTNITKSAVNHWFRKIINTVSKHQMR